MDGIHTVNKELNIMKSGADVTDDGLEISGHILIGEQVVGVRHGSTSTANLNCFGSGCKICYLKATVFKGLYSGDVIKLFKMQPLESFGKPRLIDGVEMKRMRIQRLVVQYFLWDLHLPASFSVIVCFSPVNSSISQELCHRACDRAALQNYVRA